jgi:hypothetical protein
MTNKNVSQGSKYVTAALTAWQDLSAMRKKTGRSMRFAYGDQWSDPATDTEGLPTWATTEGDALRYHHKTVLQNNMIRPILKNIEGQFRSNRTQPFIRPLDPLRSDMLPYAEACTSRLNRVLYANECHELDASLLSSLQLSGFCAQRMEPVMSDEDGEPSLRIRNCNPFHLFFGGGHEDVLSRDLDMIGEFIDIPLPALLSSFGQSASRRRELTSLYAGKPSFPGRPQPQAGMCPLVLLWERQLRQRLFCWDKREGTWWYAPESDRQALESAPDISFQVETERFWYYRYLTPGGEILKEGPSPYAHGGHDYEIAFYPLVHGELYNFVDDLIDLQRIINRMVVQIDARLTASLKGLKVYDVRFFPGVQPEIISSIAAAPNGLLPAHPVPGKDLKDSIIQIDSEVGMTNDFQMLQTQVKLINEVSGVNSAIQGKQPSSGTTAALYERETQNAGLNTLGLMEAFEAFRIRRARKILRFLLPAEEQGLLSALEIISTPSTPFAPFGGFTAHGAEGGAERGGDTRNGYFTSKGVVNKRERRKKRG